MRNHQLADQIRRARLTTDDFAIAAEVDPKTVERWINQGRLPRRRHREAAAQALGVPEAELWPQLLDPANTSGPPDDLVHVYPTRNDVPGELWRDLLDRATESVDILVYAGLFFLDAHPSLLRPSPEAPTHPEVRVLVGDTSAEPVQQRAREEGEDVNLPTRIELSRTSLAALGASPTIVREHGTTLYNSIYRFDDDMLVNTHIFGSRAPNNPVLHLHRATTGGLFDRYLDSFEAVWEKVAHSPSAPQHETLSRMGQRIDYLDDPDAPEANSLVPSVNALVLNQRDEVLLIRRSDNGNWSLPGGAMDLGESLGEAAIRETLEETGVSVRLTGVAGLYSNPRHVIEYTSDGEVRQEMTIAFTAVPISGQPTPSDESWQVEWFDRNQLPDLKMHPSMRQRIERYFDDPIEIYWD